MSGSFLGDLAAIAYWAAFMACGILIAIRVFYAEKTTVQLWFGLVFGLVAMMWLPVLWAFALDFTIPAQLLGLVVMLFFTALIWFRYRPGLGRNTDASDVPCNAVMSKAESDMGAGTNAETDFDHDEVSLHTPFAEKEDKLSGNVVLRCGELSACGKGEPETEKMENSENDEKASSERKEIRPKRKLFSFHRKHSARKPRIEDFGLLVCAVAALALCCGLLYTHVLRPVGNTLHTGQSGYGDMSMHLGFITSFANQKAFPFYYSIEQGEKVGYPFLCDSVSATLYQLGAHLNLAYILPMLPALFCVFLGFGLLMKRWLHSEKKAVLAFLLFFVGGGFGFWYFLDGAKTNPDQFWQIFTGFYTTPTNYVNENVKWVNPIADMLIPQRATLFGWMVLFPALYLLYRLWAEKETKYIVPLGLLAGAMPLIHTHSFLALVLISATAWFATGVEEPKRMLKWWPYLLLAAALSLPQLFGFTFSQAEQGSFLRFHFNWANEGDSYLWFYIKNMGMVFLLAVPAVLACKRERNWFLITLPIWIIAECVVFQPNYYDNNKLIFIPYLFLCGLVAAFLCDVYDKLKGMGGRRVLAGLTMAVMLCSGTLTLIREWMSDYQLYSESQLGAAEFVEKNLPADAVILTAENHNNAIAALTGRNIVQGSSSYLYFHGVYDSLRYQDILRMYTEPGAIERMKEEYSIDYVLLGEYERAMGAQEIYFQSYDEVYRDGATVIYKVT